MCKPADMDDVRRVMRIFERQWRTARELSLAEAARLTGLGRTAVARIRDRAAILGWQRWIREHMQDRDYWDDF